LGGSLALSPVGIVGLIGEADRGVDGSVEQIENNVFSAEQMVSLRDKYGAGSPIADAANLAFAPSNDAQVVNGANAIYIYKTNAAVKAALALATNYATLTAAEAGTGGNQVAVTVEAATAEVLPALPALHYLPDTSGATGASAATFIANGLPKVSPATVVAYTGAAGSPIAFASAVGALADIATNTPASSSLFTGLTTSSVVTASVASSGASRFTLSGAGSISGSVAIGDIFVLGGFDLMGAGVTFNGVYLATAASTASVVEGLKLKDLAADTITAVVAGANTLIAQEVIDVAALSIGFKSISISVDSAQAAGQGASLQVQLASSLAPQIYGGTARSLLASNAANVAQISLAVSTVDRVVVSLAGGVWSTRPVIGDIVWILQDSQLAGTALANCGSFVVTAVTGSTVTLDRFGAKGTFVAINAATVTSAGVSADLRCFEGIFTVDSVIAPVTVSAAEATRVITVESTRDEIQEVSDELGGKVALTLGYKNISATAATATVNKSAKTLTTSITGVSGANLSLDLSQFATLNQLATFINAHTGYSAVVPAAFRDASPLILDGVTVGILAINATAVTALPGRIKAEVLDVENFFAESALVVADITATSSLPIVAAKAYLSGGSKGATTAASIVAALDEFQKVRINSVVPLFSRDADEDIAEGLTDSSSAYMIDAIHAAVKAHCILMSNTTNRSERHCMLAFRGDYAMAKEKAAIIANSRAQLFIQDIRAVGSDGQVKWMQPHMLAAMHAGMRSGAELALPLTFKYYNVSGIRHTASPLNALATDVVIDFDPRTQYNDAIDNGICFLEQPPAGGYRLVLDNTTYRKDDNWLLNRGATQHNADVVVYDFRTRMEQIVVGQRNTDLSVGAIRASAESLLAGYANNRQLARTADAPNGFKNLSISLNGNTVSISGTLVMAEGIDFVLEEWTLTRNTAQA
jgi:hypothetical protein